MSLLLRRIVQNPTSSKSVPVAKLFRPYPLGRNPSSLPKIKRVRDIYIDSRPISLRYRVTAMLEMSNLDVAAKMSYLALSDKFRVESDTVFICNSVIGAMCGAKRYDEAISLFNYFFNERQTLPNMLSCNLIIKAHCDLGRVDDALELYRHVALDGVLSPGIEPYRILTKALVDAKRFDEAFDLVSCMSRFDSTVYDILIRGFLDSGKFVKASLIFEELKKQSSELPLREYQMGIAMVNVSFMRYWFKEGKDEEAMEIYAALDKGEVAKPIVGNRVLEVLVEHGKKTEALELFEEMVEVCDSETVEIMLKGFSEDIIPIERVRKACYRTMIAGFCEKGNMSEAEKLFAEMFSDVESDEMTAGGPDVSTFRAMINGYVKVGRVDDAIKMLDKMKISKLRKLAIHREV